MHNLVSLRILCEGLLLDRGYCGNYQMNATSAVRSINVTNVTQ